MFVWLVIILLRVCAALHVSPIAQTLNGPLVGKYVFGDRCEYKAFEGIPYAQIPIANLRFEAPQPLVGLWANGGVLNATQRGADCMQWQNGLVIGSEDCLYLNVYVPSDRNSTVCQRMPVMVFIHGGGFMWDSASEYGEEFIMQQSGLILVTFSYRLGPLGFLSTESTEITGNMGLKDQSLALHWVHENIQYFGGDEEKILLAGWSAGAASVNYHMVSPYTLGTWFNSAASFSGTALRACHTHYAGAARRKALQLAQQLNCSGTDESIKRCLQSLPAAEIIKQVPTFYKFGNHPFAIFGPIVDSAPAGGDLRFLSDDVASMLVAGKAKVKPWLVSRTADDGAFGTAEFLRRNKQGVEEHITELNDRWFDLAPILLFFNASQSAEQQRHRAAQLRRTYFGADSFSLKNFHCLEQLFNDELSISHTQQLLQLYANHTKEASIYAVVYDNPAAFGFGQLLSQRYDWKFGTLHGDDIFLIFRNDKVRGGHALRVDELQISKELIGMLRNLANDGIPTYGNKSLCKYQAQHSKRDVRCGNVNKLTNAGMFSTDDDDTPLCTKRFKATVNN